MNKKKRLIIAGVCVFTICIATVGVTTLNKDDSRQANVEYVNDESPEISPHDGDVLVDSLKLTKLPGDAGNGELPSEMVTSDDISDLKNSDTYFNEARATVNMDRNQIISMLSDVIAEAQTATEKENASAQKLKIIEYMDKEKTIENLILTKGLPECMVLITDNAVNVTVNKQDLTQSDIAKIYDITMRETGRSASGIIIQSKY
ncbi:MAG: SpoIIIAH-like family protein [Eubacteriales bacterium]|nr:SpoIIIAH-like family protein [Eubacteriales bacterium]MDD4389457.1 SpoIIIAH-like family protein [Eubacteriales bacterium]